MPSGNFQVSYSSMDSRINQTYTRQADGGSTIDLNPLTGTGLPVGFAGELTTRTNDTEGTVTLADGHGITTGLEVDLYWDGGIRYGVTVGTVAGNAVPLTDTGSGDDLPIAETEIVVSQRVRIAEFIDGDQLVALSAVFELPSAPTAAGRCLLQYLDEVDDEITTLTLRAREPVLIDTVRGDANPFAGKQALAIVASNSSSTTPARLVSFWLQGVTS